MGLISTTEKQTREIQTQAQKLTRYRQFLELKREYKDTIKYYTITFLEVNAPKYKTLERLYYKRDRYIDDIVKKVNESGIITDGFFTDNKYKYFDVEKDVQDNFYSNFITFKKSYIIDKKAELEEDKKEINPIHKSIFKIILSFIIIYLTIKFFIILLGLLLFISIIYGFIYLLIKPVKKRRTRRLW